MKWKPRLLLITALCLTLSLWAFPAGFPRKLLRGLLGRTSRETVEQQLPHTIRHQADEMIEPIVLRESSKTAGDKGLEAAPKLILATGAGGSLIYGTHELTSVQRELGNKVRGASADQTHELIDHWWKTFFDLSLIIVIALCCTVILKVIIRAKLGKPPP